MENVIDLILENQKKRALDILNSDKKVEEKIVGIISSMRPNIDEVDIATELNKEKNYLMHKRINEKIIEILTPILSIVINEGKEKKIFNCDNVEERIRLLLIISSQMFDDNNYNINSVTVFIDTVEKILGCKNGSMKFIINLIKEEDSNE